MRQQLKKLTRDRDPWAHPGSLVKSPRAPGQKELWLKITLNMEFGALLGAQSVTAATQLAGAAKRYRSERRRIRTHIPREHREQYCVSTRE
eukprot:2423899-Amphidinium_carterae.1